MSIYLQQCQGQTKFNERCNHKKNTLNEKWYCSQHIDQKPAPPSEPTTQSIKQTDDEVQPKEEDITRAVSVVGEIDSDDEAMQLTPHDKKEAIRALITRIETDLAKLKLEVELE